LRLQVRKQREKAPNLNFVEKRNKIVSYFFFSARKSIQAENPLAIELKTILEQTAYTFRFLRRESVEKIRQLLKQRVSRLRKSFAKKRVDRKVSS